MQDAEQTQHRALEGKNKLLSFFSMPGHLKISCATSFIWLIVATSLAQNASQLPSLGSYLCGQPKISEAVFEKEMFSTLIPEGARKQVFSVTLDGDNYFLSVLNSSVKICGGKFNGSSWEFHSGYLTLSDPVSNGTNSPIEDIEQGTRATANLMANLGIVEMVKGTAHWDEEGRHLMAASSRGRDIIIDFNYGGQPENPTEALIKDFPGGQMLARIVFGYDKNFNNGKFPSQITRYPGDGTNDGSKSFTLKISKLVLSDAPIPLPELDPKSKLKSFLNSTMIYSNHEVFELGSFGQLQKVQTLAEANSKMEKIIKSGKMTPLNRFLLLLILLLPPLVFCVKIWREKAINPDKRPNSMGQGPAPQAERRVG